MVISKVSTYIETTPAADRSRRVKRRDEMECLNNQNHSSVVKFSPARRYWGLHLQHDHAISKGGAEGVNAGKHEKQVIILGLRTLS